MGDESVQKLLIASIRLVRALTERCLDTYMARHADADPLSMQLDIKVITATEIRVHAWLQCSGLTVFAKQPIHAPKAFEPLKRRCRAPAVLQI